MSTDKKDSAEFNVEESQDGSAVIDLPEDMIAAGDDAPEEPNKVDLTDKRDGGEVSAEEDDHPDDTDAVRAAKRARRRSKKDLIRKTNEEKDLRLQQLQRENEEFKRRLSNVERETKNSQILRIEKHLEDQKVRLEYAKMKMSEAVQAGDGEAMVEAQTMFNEAQAAVGEFSKAKLAAEREARQPQSDVPSVDPTIQRNAAEWMRRNSWYRPDTSDRDSQIAKKIDELLVTEGLNPSDPDYWDELDNRLQKALPHRYNDNTDSNSAVRKPRNVVGSSGREASAAYGGNNRTQFVLSPERVKAMKEVGAWDNPARKKAMIENFIKYDRANGTR